MKNNPKEKSAKKLHNKNLLSQLILWTPLFSIITVIACFTIVIIKFPSPLTPDIRYLSFSALSVWLIGEVIKPVEIAYHDVLHETLQSLSLSLLLIIFLLFIRRRKPAIFRYPYYMIFVPLLVPVAQVIMMDAQVMREIIFMSVHGLSIAVFILLMAGYRKELNHKVITIIGIILLLWGFSFFWILQKHYIVFEWAWGITNLSGVVLCVYSFSDLLQTDENPVKN